MISTISEDALRGQQSRIMAAMRAATNPAPGNDFRDIASALMTQNSGGANYLDTMRKFGQEQAKTNIGAEQGIYDQMKEMAARGDADAMAVSKAVDDASGGDPIIAAKLSDSLHNDPQPINRLNATTMVMKHANELGVTPLSVQNERAKLAKTQADAAKTQGEANQLNIFNPMNGTNPTQGVPSASNVAPSSNDEFLSKLPTPVATQVKALAEGRMPFPSGFALKTPYWQQMLQTVSMYDPSFDAVNYNARAATRKDFTSGKGAQNITSLNTAIGHLGALDDAFSGLKNTDYPAYNAVANAVGRAAGKTNVQTALKDVNTKAIAVAGELAKVFRSTGMSSHEIQDWKDQISSNNSPAENKKVIESALELMNSRLDAIGQQYNQGMGTTKDPMQLLSPKAQIVYQKLTAKPDEITKAVEPAPTTGPIADQSARKVIDYTEYFK